ncbi:hypothetical protein AAFN69_27515 [Streptomyces sp. CAU 1734]
MPDAVDELGRWRLRPGVRVTALRDGLHLRGWAGSVTLEGSGALPGLWRLVEEALRTDGGAAALASRAPAGSALRAALCTLIGGLRAHDLLVGNAPVPRSPAAGWLGAAAERPERAARALRRARVRVEGPEPGPGGALAGAAVRALEGCGVRAAAVAGGERWLLLTAEAGGGEPLAVAAGVGGGTGFVTPAGDPGRVRADAAALVVRLRITGGEGEEGGGGELAELVAGAAVQRLLCAVGGLPDPDGGESGGRVSVLVADGRPLRARYRPWTGSRPAAGGGPLTLEGALASVAELGDERVGVLAPPLPGSLPQLPVALVGCASAGGDLVAGAVRADLARLEAVCRAAELRLGGGREGVVVGAGDAHALGRALRRGALRAAVGGGEGMTDPGPPDHPQARYWWSVLTGRLGVGARLSVARLGPGVFRAVVEEGAAGGPGGRVLGRAVEATAADAVAFAALASVVRVRARERDPAARWIAASGGAVAALASAGVERAGWEDECWTAGWLAAVAGRESALHTALGRRAGVRVAEFGAAGGGGRLGAALRECGFTVLDIGGGSR